MTYHAHYEKFDIHTSSYQSQGQSLVSQHDPKEGMLGMGIESEEGDASMGVFVALADVAHGSGPDWLRRGSVVAGAFGSRVERAIDSDDSVATSLFVEVSCDISR